MPHHRTNSMHLFMLSREPLLTAIIWLPRDASQIQGIRCRRLRRRNGRHRRVSGPGRCFGQIVAEVVGCRLSTRCPLGSIAAFRHRATKQRPRGPLKAPCQGEVHFSTESALGRRESTVGWLREVRRVGPRFWVTCRSSVKKKFWEKSRKSEVGSRKSEVGSRFKWRPSSSLSS